MSKLRFFIDKLEAEQYLSKNEFTSLIDGRSPELSVYLFERSSKVRQKYYGKKVYARGLIELTNYCKNNCYYCGIRRDNRNCERYRLSKEQIITCCETGFSLGFRTFVLQGGEDPFYTDDIMVDIISEIKRKYPDCALTLSIGEKSRESYNAYYNAGADRYLLRHETANSEHYEKLHPKSLTAENRKRCLYDLKEIGFQVGCGFMVGSPFQTSENLAEDMLFLHELKPHMVGIGPFLPHKDTPFAKEKSGTEELTLFMLGLTRLLLPQCLLPATTALGTISNNGRENGILAGANVVMPNLSPIAERNKYSLYNNKICTGEEAAENLTNLEKRITSIGYELDMSKGDHLTFNS